ncbi:transposase [Microtetraspora malaysiensis]|uniref:Transposase n=1 Tax=Microtetraspora malaysiensis TaxID=161358 RepID=A0ABW6SQC6_9ACTN
MWSYATAAGRPRCEDRIRCAKETGLRNLPLHDLTQNQIWCKIVALACELLAWMQMLALHGIPARRYEPKRLRLRLFAVSARLVRGGRRMRIAASWPWVSQLVAAITRLHELPALTCRASA